ncbi:hypothetical protein KI387_028453, partial [Taxus chinensis]
KLGYSYLQSEITRRQTRGIVKEVKAGLAQQRKVKDGCLESAHFCTSIIRIATPHISPLLCKYVIFQSQQNCA